MADEKIVTSIVANSDFSNLIADVQRVTASLSKLQQEFAGSNRALAGQINAANAMFNQTMLKTGQFSSHFVSLTSDVEKFGRNLDSGRLKLRDYFRVYQDHVRTHGGLVRDLAKQQVQLQNAVLQPLGRNAQGLMQYNVQIPRGLDLTKNKTALLKQELQIMNKVIQDGGVQLINWGKNTQWAGRQLTVGLTLPLAAFGKAAADAFRQADQELTRLTKVYGDVAGTSAEELGKVRKEVSATAKELASSMGVNFAETIALAADIAATGKTGNELLSSVSETTRLAVLGEVDRQEAMKATLAIQSAFKQNTEELAESINFLNAVENQTSTTLNDLVEAIPKAGPVIKGLGGDVQDLALYLTAMREGGINASEGANALKSALASLINPTDVAVKKFKGFGIDLLSIVKGNAGDVTATLFALQGALDKLDPLTKQQAIEQLFGKFQFSRLNALFENLGRQGSQTLQVLDLMSASASELEAVASRELEAVTESAAGRFRRAMESLKADLAGVGEDFLNIGTKLLNVLGGIIDFAQKLPDPIKKLITFGGAFTAIIGPVIMLTGVLANFFGYIIKGLGHFKALFKGAEGFRLLTPEIMAARNASEMLGNEFYSDAKAADTLRMAIERLNEDLIGLQVNATNATKASAGLGQALITSAGTPIMPMGGLGGPRQVIQGHPLLGGESRAAAHLNPRNPNDPASIFGLTLQPIPLNRRIGRTPQILMSERLPDIEGVTSVGGVSTGVVASEHARYAALMATLGMQSRQEIEALKKTIGLGGQVSQEFIATFDDILPMTQRLTANAAAQSTAIVADLRAGKITADQALARIFAANAELERMLGSEVSAYATSRGRTIDLTKAPLIDQPVVDVAGKPNTRGMFRTGIFRDVMDAVGRATRTRTLGGPYSIETTRRLNKGGGVFLNNGDQVPGPNINADVVPAMLTPGEFVIRRDIAQQDPDGMRALNEGRAMVVPFGANRGGQVPQYFNGGDVLRAFASRSRMIGGLRTPNLRPGSTSGPSTINAAEAGSGLSFGRVYRRSSKIYSDPAFTAYGISPTKPGEFLVHAMVPGFLRRTSGLERSGSSVAIPSSRLQDFGISTSSRAPFLQGLPTQFVKNTQAFNDALKNGALASDFRTVVGSDMVSLLLFLKDQGVSPQQAISIADDAARILNAKVLGHPGKITEATFGRLVNDSSVIAISKGFKVRKNRGGRVRKFNRGGMVPGYNRGGRVPGYRFGGGIRGMGGMGGMGMGSMLASMLLGTAGYTAGSAFGPMGGMIGSMVGSMAPMMFAGNRMGRMGLGPTPQQRLGMQSGMIPNPDFQFGTPLSPTNQMYLQSAIPQIPKRQQSIFSQGTPFLGRLAGDVEKATVSSSKFSQILGRLALGLTRTNVAVGAVAAGLGLAKIALDKYNDTQRVSAAEFGFTAQSAEKAGVKFTDYGQKMKESVQAQKLFIQQNKLTYQSLASAGTPFKMTIAEYKELKKQVKETMQAQLEMINAVSSKDVKRVAVQLKEQFVAAGMSAEEAAKKIYTLFELSNKSSLTISALGTSEFGKIIDAQTAAVSALNTFNYAKVFENAKDQATQLNTALTAIDAAIKNTYTEAERAAKKKNEYFDTANQMYEAEKKTLDEINLKVRNQEAIGEDVLNNLAEQNPLIRQFANEQDTIVSLWQKIRIQARGYTGDLENLNAKQTQRLYDLTISISKAVEETNKKGLLKDQYKEYERLYALQQRLSNAAKGQSVREQIDAREALRAIDKKIKKINEEAEARKKALREEAQAEDVALQIQKQRLEYERAVASGDFDTAATAQIELRRLQNEQQVLLTEQQIEEKRLRDVAPLEKEKERLQREQEKLADTAALAGENLENVNKKLNDQKTKIDNVNNAMSAFELGLITNAKNIEGLAANFIDAAKEAGIKFPEYVYTDGGRPTRFSDASVLQQAKALSDEFGKLLDKNLQANGVSIESDGDIYINGKKLNLGEDSRGGKATPAGVTFGAERKVVQAETLKDAAKKAQTGKKTQTYVPATGGAGFDVFEWNGKTYVIDKQTGVIYNFDPKTNVVGDRAKYAGGGAVSGPGTSTSDSIPAYLSNGEYVVRASAVDHYGKETFDALNAKRFSKGGLAFNPFGMGMERLGKSYSPPMNIPSFDSGVNMLYSDTIAQLHKGEAVIPEKFNPWNSNASNPLGGEINISMPLTVNAAPGMDEDYLINKAAIKVQQAMELALTKSGRNVNMSRRYS